MKQQVAFAVWENRISPLFDASRSLLVVSVENGVETGRKEVQVLSNEPHLKAKELTDFGIQLLVCGAISKDFAQALEDQAIHFISFVSGNVENIIQSFLNGVTLPSKYCMPGCGNYRRRRLRRGNRFCCSKADNG